MARRVGQTEQSLSNRRWWWGGNYHASKIEGGVKKAPRGTDKQDSGGGDGTGWPGDGLKGNDKGEADCINVKDSVNDQIGGRL